MSQSSIFRTSSFRHALLYAALTGFCFLVLFGVIFWSTAHFMRHQIDDSVSSEIDEIRADSRAGGAAGMAAVVQGLARHSSGFVYLLQDASGAVLAGNLPGIDPVVGAREWAEARDSPKGLSIGSPNGSPNASSYAAIRGRGLLVGGNYLFVGWSTLQLRAMEDMIVSAFLWGLAASLALALAGGVVTSGRLLRRIESVSETSRNIIDGDLQRRVPVTKTADEFDHLAGSINAMLDRIQSLMDGLRQVTTDIAHDMRTPLTRLRQRLETAQHSPLNAAQLRDMLAATVVEIDAILEVFGALLRIAQIDSGARRAAFRVVPLGDVLHTALELYRPAVEEKIQTLDEAVGANLMVLGDRDLLLQLFANLLENAVRHSPAGARLGLTALQTAATIDVSVTDDGPGIPSEQRARVLQRFYRLETSRTTPGSGLGLSLSLAIVNLHEATLTLADNRPGLRVTVSLPVSSSVG
jgi:signal transduction histidine kinase